MTLRRFLLALSASYFLSAAVRAEYSVAQVPLIYFRADEFFPANRQYIHSDYIDTNNGDVLIQSPSDNNHDVQEGPLSVNEISQLKNIIRERQPVTAEDPSSDREGRNQDLSQNFNADIYTSGDVPQNVFQDNQQSNFGDDSQNTFGDNARSNFGDNVQTFFQDNAQPTFRNNEQTGPNFQNDGPIFQNYGPNFQNNEQTSPKFQINGQPGPNFQNNDQSGPNFPINGQFNRNFPNNGQNGPNFQNNNLPGPNFQNNALPNFPQNGQPGPNFQNNGQPGLNFQNNGQPGPNFQNNGQPGLNFQNNGQPGLNFQNIGQPGLNFQNNGQSDPNFPGNAQFDRNFPNNGQSGPNFQINGQAGPNFPNNVLPGPIFTSNGQPGPSIVSPTLGPIDSNNNIAVITEFPPPSEIRTEPATPSSVTVNDVLHASQVYQGNSYAPPAPEGNSVHVEHHVEHHETVHPNDPLVHRDDSFAHAPNNGLENHPAFPTPASIHLHETPAGHPHYHNHQAPHFNGPFHHPEHPSHFEIASGPFFQNDRFNAHFAGHGPSEFSGNGINAVYGPFDPSSFDPSFLQQNAVILNNADTFFSPNLPNLPIFPQSNYEQNQFIFPQGFPQPSSLPLSHSNFPEFPNYPPGPTVLSISTQGDVITSSPPSQSNSPSPDTFTAQPPPSQQLSGPNGSSDF